MKIAFAYCLILILGISLHSLANPLLPGNFFEQDHLIPLSSRDLWQEEYGLTIDLIYTGEFFSNLHGGLNTNDANEYRGDFSIFAQLDTEKAGWWPGGLFFLQLQEQHGKGLTEDHVGDFQVLSNIDADDFKQISEFWYEHYFANEQFRIKLGKMEANTDFAFVEYGLEFINSSPGFSPTIPLVSYPDQDWGIVLGYSPVDWHTLTAGLYQGDPDGGRSLSNTIDKLRGPMVMVEEAFHYHIADYPGHFRVGLWWNGLDVEELDKSGSGEIVDQRYGVYLTWDQFIWKESLDDLQDQQGIGVFAQYGWTPEERSEAEEYIGTGLQWVGALPERHEDVWGLGVFHVDFSDEIGLVENSETAIELFYKLQMTRWMSLKPDIQYIFNPGGNDANDALALGLRWEIIF